MNKRLTKKASDKLDNYLQTKFNYDIYHQLTTDHHCDRSYVLFFLNLLYSQIEYIKENKTKLSLIIKNLEKLDLNEAEFTILCESLNKYFSKMKGEDEQIAIFCREITRLQEVLYEVKENEDKNESESLEKYIKNEFDLEILNDIEDNPLLFNCEPLDFFQIFEGSILFIKQNRQNPLALREHLKKEFPNKTYFLTKLEEALKREIDGINLTDSEFQMRELLESVDSSSDTSKRKLIEASEIVKKRRIQVEKVEPLAQEFQKMNQKINFINEKNVDTANDKIQKHNGLNRESAFLFFEYLFNYANVKTNNVKKVEVIERLTGYSHKQTKNLFAWLEKEKLYIEETKEINDKFFNDMNFVRKCFEMLGLEAVTELIDKDLGN